MFNRRLSRPLAIGATVVVIGGGALGIISSSSSSSNGSAGASTGQTAQVGFAAKAAGSTNARSGPAAGGVAGTVSSVSTSSFTVSTTGGTKVTIKKTSSITYRKGTSSASASAVTKGATVLVLGTANGTAMTATKVTVNPVTVEPTTFTPSKPVAFKQGSPSAAQKDGQIPTNYTEGSGTIVSGTTANKATTAALAAYPGGVVDRVVKLSNGEYEVHNIGVNWPHHVFVSSTFKVVGAD
jgi:hypothetical protein